MAGDRLIEELGMVCRLREEEKSMSAVGGGLEGV